jgi:hypothetical protein
MPGPRRHGGHAGHDFPYCMNLAGRRIKACRSMRDKRHIKPREEKARRSKKSAAFPAGMQ